MLLERCNTAGMLYEGGYPRPWVAVGGVVLLLGVAVGGVVGSRCNTVGMLLEGG